MATRSKSINKEEIEKYLQEGLSCPEIAIKMNKHRTSICKFIRRHDLIINKKYKQIKIGTRFGKLIVIENLIKSEGISNSRGLYKCQCDCGKAIEITGILLINNEHSDKIKSCGCFIKECHIKHRLNENRTINQEYHGHKKNGRLNYNSFLSREDWEKIIFLPCHYCGEIDIRNRCKIKKTMNPTEDEIKKFEVKINGVDRLDSTKGYILENCVPCCGMCNFMKKNYTKERFLEKIEKIYLFKIKPRDSL